MSKLLNPAQPHRFEIPGQDHLPEGERRVYLLRVPGVADKAALNLAVARAGARRYYLPQLLDNLCQALPRIFARLGDAASAEPLLSQVEDCRAALSAMAALPVDATDAERGAAVVAFATANNTLDPVFSFAAAEDPILGKMVRDNLDYPVKLGTEAARLFLLGGDNTDAPIDRHPAKGLLPEVLAAIPEGDRMAIGAEIERMLRPSEAEAGKSALPSGGSAAGTNSTGGSSDPKAKSPKVRSRSAGRKSAGQS